MVDLNKLLQNIYLFQNLSGPELREVSSICDKINYTSGDIVIAEGEKADAMFVVEYGSLNLHKRSAQGEQNIGMLGSGSHFGELPFVDAGVETRALTIEATESSVLFKISYAKLENLLSNDLQLSYKFYKALAHYLSSRLRTVTLDLSFAKEKNLKYF